MEQKTILHRPYKMLALGLFLILTLCLLGFVAAKKQISILADGNVVTLETRAMDPKSALKEAGIMLADNDGYFVVNKKRLEEGSTIEVVRAMPVKVWVAGESTEYSIGRGTVKEVLQALDIDYRDCTVYPSLDAKPVPGMEINILDSDTRIEEEKRSIPFVVERRQDSHLTLGEEKTLAAGQNGEKVITVSYTNIDGKMVKRELGETITVEPQSEIVAVGTNKTVETSRGNVSYRMVKTMEATAYTAADGDGNGITSIGLTAKHGIIAVDPRVIPYGTRVYIPGYGFAVAGDTGGAIIGNRIDLFMDSYHDAISFGRRNVEMYILE